MSSGRTSTPTLINLPPPPVDPMTPSDMPGTPTSTTTSLSELSTVAIKDGHRGHLHHNHHNPMDAERADRISRLAGLDRVGHNRLSAPNANNASGGYNRSDFPANSNAPPGSTSNNPAGTTPGGSTINPAQAYFDANNAPQIYRERSTVGSASATGSVGGRTTWASGSASDGGYDRSDVTADRMSDMDVDGNSSVGAFSDDNPSAAVASGMVPLGEATAGRAPGRPLGVPSPVAGAGAGGSPVQGKSPHATAAAQQQQLLRQMQQVQDARMIDGITFDKNVVDTVTRTPPSADE